MKHDYTDDEIRSACKDVMSLRAFLDALPTRSAQPERPQPWPGQQAAIDAAFCSSNRGSYTALKLSNPFDWEQQAPARLAIAQAYDKARPQSAEIANLKSHIDHLEERDRQGREELVRLRLRAELREARKSEDHWHSEAELLRAEEAKTQADLAALRQSTQSAQPILADDGRSLGQVAFDAGNAVQKIKFPKREIETWEESAEVHEMIEAAAQAVAAVVLAQAVRRMEAVPMIEMWKVFYRNRLIKEVRDLLIAAAKGEGQAMTKNVPGDKCPSCGAEEVESNTPNTTYACGSSDYDGRPDTFHPGDKCETKPVVVNEPPQNERQPDLSGESEKQDLGAMVKAAREAAIKGLTGPAWIPHDGGPCPLKDEDVEQFEFKIRGGGVSGPVYVPNGWRWSNDGTTGDIIAYRVLKWKPGFGPEKKAQQAEPAQPTTSPGWTPTVGQTVRLKSGGPVMVVHHIAKDGSIACTHNINGAFEFATLPASCLTPVPNP